MAFEKAFLDLMPLTCTLRPRSAASGYVGEATYGTAITPAPRCHVEYKAGTFQNNDGVQKHYEGSVYLGGVYAVDTTWQLLIPIPGGEREVKIITVEQNTDQEGFHHTALRFGAL